MKKILMALTLAVGIMLGLAAPEIIAQTCTLTPNLGLCKGARGASEWDVFLNSNFDLIDSLTLNTGSGAQTKTGILTLSNVQPLKLTGTGFQPNDVLFLDATKTVSRSANLQWDGTKLAIAGAYIDTAGAAYVLGLTIPTGAGTGKVLTSDGSGNATWQTVAGASSGWTPGTGKVTLTTAADEVGIGVASPTEKLEINGGVKVGVAQTTQEGVIQWTGSHFQGYTGSTWVDLDYTSSSAGGWSDGGTSITLTTATDTLGIGAAADANFKMLVSAATDYGVVKLVQSLTGSATHAMIEGTSTWNISTNTATLLKYSLTDTASNSASKLLEFLVGGGSKFALRKDGQLTLAAGLIATTGTFSGALSAPSITLSTGAVNGYVLTSDGSGNASWQASAGGSGIPSGMIATFDASCPVGWTRVSAFDGKFLYGGSSYGATGGAASHAHAVNIVAFNTDSGGSHGHTVPMGTFTTDQCVGCDERVQEPGTKGVSAEAHTHNVTITDRTISSSGSHAHSIDPPNTATDNGSSLPPYITVVYCKKD